MTYTYVQGYVVKREKGTSNSSTFTCAGFDNRFPNLIKGTMPNPIQKGFKSKTLQKNYLDQEQVYSLSKFMAHNREILEQNVI